MTEEIIIERGCIHCSLCDEDEECYLNRCKRLEQENKELKEENIKVKKEFNNLIAEIISDMEYTGEIACNGESPKEHLHQMQKALSALEEIRKLFPKQKPWKGMLTELEEEILNKIDEAL